jgi:hypothetical protein
MKQQYFVIPGDYFTRSGARITHINKIRRGFKVGEITFIDPTKIAEIQYRTSRASSWSELTVTMRNGLKYVEVGTDRQHMNDLFDALDIAARKARAAYIIGDKIETREF